MAHSTSSDDYSHIHEDHPRHLIPVLCKQFYLQGWFTGTGGSISIRDGQHIYIAPSGVLKERIKPDDLFVLNKADGAIIQSPPKEKNLVISQCTPLFLDTYFQREAGAVIHSHGEYITLASMLYGKEFKIKNQEMIKGIYNPIERRSFRCDEELIVPIIENTRFEADLKNSMLESMKNYPLTNAVIVRRHGIYVWGDTWQKCKGMAEIYHYLCKLAVEQAKLGINDYIKL